MSDWSSDVCSSDLAVLGADRAAFDQRQQVALHALAGYVGAHALAALGNLVDLVDEHDAVLLAGLDRGLAHLVLVDQLARLFFDQPRARGPDAPAALVGLAAAEVGAPPPHVPAHLPPTP